MANTNSQCPDYSAHYENAVERAFPAGASTYRLTVDLASDLDPAELHAAAIDALADVAHIAVDRGLAVLSAEQDDEISADAEAEYRACEGH